MIQHKIGIGYDIHRLEKGRKLFLGGVEIPYEKGLKGHSDGDVVLHAICDAILGALGKGDIGEHFPNTDAQYKDISSLDLLKKVNVLLQDEGYDINNIDTFIQAEEPNLKDFKQKMRAKIASQLMLKVEAVNVKATTQERLGAIGNKEGIAAFASVIIKKEG